MPKTLNELAHNPKNPRRTTDEKIAMLKKSLGEFGDLGGVVLNRTSGQLVGGHQRTTAFKESNPALVIERQHNPPTAAGTVAEGYFEIGGERFTYREVEWDARKEKAGNIAANKGAGEWNWSQLTEDMVELDDGSFDMNLTMFDEKERERLVVGWEAGDKVEKTEVNFDAMKTTIKVKCPKEIEDEVRVILKRAFLETSLEGVEVV